MKARDRVGVGLRGMGLSARALRIMEFYMAFNKRAQEMEMKGEQKR